MQDKDRTAKWLKVLQAASQLDRKGFPIQALIVAAWLSDREAFGLPGYRRTYPDSNHVTTYLYGRRGLIATGYLVKQKFGSLYRLTEEGRKAADEFRTEILKEGA